MALNSTVFILLALFATCISYSLKKSSIQNIWLLLINLSFLLILDWRYAGLLIVLTIFLFFAGLLIENKKKQGESHRTLLIVSTIITIAPLLFFKYYNFTFSNICALFNCLGFSLTNSSLKLLLPIGISFYTFRLLTYIFDISRYDLKAERGINGFVNFAAFTTFFPSIISGPIDRASSFLPQLHKNRVADYSNLTQGLLRFFQGWIIKVAVADHIALFIDPIFSSYRESSSISLVLCLLLYPIQLYADFMGYSHMAIGIGKMLGIKMSENFNRPYFAKSITEFWHRWHISLTTWLKYYLYIPLGGSRCGKLRNYINIMVVFLVSGIWHGASWTFVLWGFLHGISQIIEKISGLNNSTGQLQKKGVLSFVRVLCTFLMVAVFWIFFRMPTVGDTISFFGCMLSNDLSGFTRPGFGSIVFTLLFFIYELFEERNVFSITELKKPWAISIVIILSIIAIYALRVDGSQTFIYQQF